MNQKGMIALITVFVVSGVLLVTGIAVVLVSADLAMSTKGYMSKVNLQSTSRTCLEECLYKLKFDDTFVGQVTYADDSGSCVADVSDDSSPGIKNIDLVSTFDGYSESQTHQVDVSEEPYRLLD